MSASRLPLFGADTWVRRYVFVAIAPRGIAAHAGDAELSGEFQMFGELIAIHGQVRLKPDPTYEETISCGVRL